ncbi:rRNA maturation RNase YbeY [Mycoplasmopsis arginini]|uniref:Endoribonuclease YbeY n=1 Tax=Mycoplasmopsis arginini TaxID=2094 RepID=A0AA43R0P2_MYCAR|nr:rRNA maturation RNase YbeY [Mycoplasmopsis arginini]MCY2902680.1 rRNA maturation RNase YbeY [Mycoplasmopsis arginini QMP CG1-2758]MDI3349347.1 rRNA maturation RNase YbeY [Mycoplasmopsis arginini]MDI3350339.1 rRNA maturation RNase YbeY [Mycoplasmopsis arginini]MDI3350962.1 rRNA maturation RNase YbeY [Mycoplasmopsis arginini]MDI3352262.1 rRNA maturation RNase YbeY [Mycoplasmopsis arginini]
MNKLTIKNKSLFCFKFEQDFLNILKEAKEEFGSKKNLSVDLLFVNKFKMKKLNNVYRNKNYTTDILSFPLEAANELDFLDYLELGQIIISPWKIKKQAMEFNHSLRREFCYIFAHGVAHLFGFDHQTEEETKIMNGHVDNIMAKLGINRY